MRNVQLWSIKKYITGYCFQKTLSAAVSISYKGQIIQQFKIDERQLLSSADNICIQIGPRSGLTNFGPDLDPNHLTL